MTRRSRFLIAALAAAASSAAAAHPAGAGPFMPLGRITEAPRGFVEMCRSDSTFCASPTRGDGDGRMVTGAITRRAFAAEPATGDALAEVVPPVIVSIAWRGSSSGTPFDAMRATVASIVEAAMRRDTREAPPRPVLAAAPDIDPTATSEAAFSPVSGPILSRDDATLLQHVNRRVNGRVRQRSDEVVYGRSEYWHRSGVGRGAQGDCEDIAIEKRFELVAAGFDPRRLSFAVVYQRSVGLHTVLVARTGAGDVVLDSRTPYIHRWDETDYSWVSIQSPTSPMEWHALGNRHAVEMAAQDASPAV